MDTQANQINQSYEQFYAERKDTNVYPTEFVVRIFRATYPHLQMAKPKAGQKILDIGFGDGRNTAFLCDLGLDVSGIEITSGIVEQTRNRLDILGHQADLRVGRNSQIPFGDHAFDYILACHSCYYCDEGDLFFDNLTEYARVLKPGGYLIASVPDQSSYIFQQGTKLDDGSIRIAKDPYKNREGYRLHAFSTSQEIQDYCCKLFNNFSFASAKNNYFGIDERVFWVVCQRQ